MKEMIQVKRPETTRACLVCGDGTLAVQEVTIRTGVRNWLGFAYCEKHTEQLKVELSK